MSNSANSNNSVNNANNSIVIRCYLPADVDDIKDLFVSGMRSNFPSFYSTVMFGSNFAIAFWTCILVEAIIIITKYYSSSALKLGIIVVGGSVAIVAIGVHVYLSRMFTYYTQLSCDDDLSDIEGVYTKRGGIFLVATLNNAIVGIVAGQIKNNNNQQQLELRRMSVSVHHQKKGIGTQLIKALEEYAKKETKNVTTIFLTCTSVQFSAHALYKRNGFSLKKTLPMSFIMTNVMGLYVYYFEKKIK